MSAAKHTLLEWQTDAKDSRFVFALNPGGYNRFWFHVHGPSDTPTEELEAVGRLAAAAPKLLEALADLVIAAENIGGMHVEGWVDLDKRVADAHKVLDRLKTTGEQA